ncbi:hypothetical protein MKX03_035106 [Papaver bracteatum]|nr:hypothetical protein MKX03_035106 [Papaver bracteatum]
METPTGVIVFTSIGVTHYGFDIFSVKVPSNLDEPASECHQLTDGISINFNGQFVDEDETVTYISERTGAPQIYLTQKSTISSTSAELLPTVATSLFQDRPVIRNDKLYFVSAHENPNQAFKSWSAVYSKTLGGRENDEIVRVTPNGVVDYSPAVSRSGNLVAVASYGDREWKGEFHDLDTDIVVFKDSDPTQRVTVSRNGGWPTFSDDGSIFFHRKCEDGWWSIFRADLPENICNLKEFEFSSRRVTPPGVHAFTPSASHDGKRIAVATRRRGNKFRHIEIFDLESESFYKVTELISPEFHHYNPFFSPESGFLGYHRFRGESGQGESTIPNLIPVISPLKHLNMFRLNGAFPSLSSDGNFIAYNHDLAANAGVQIAKSDGTKVWTVFRNKIAFGVSWSQAENNVIYSSIGPIFESAKMTVQIARISFNEAQLENEEIDQISAEVKMLTKEDSGNNAFPSCSPDGKEIVFRSGRSGYKNLYIVDAVNGEFDGKIRQLTEGPWIDTMPSWSPDGKLIAFSSNRHNPADEECFSIYFINPDGTNLRRFFIQGVDKEHADRERINHVYFSPNSKWLLFTANLGGNSAEPVSLPNQFQPYGDLYIVKVADGSGLQRLTCNAFENGTPTWHSGSANLDKELLASKESENFKKGEKLKGQFAEPLWITFDI